MNILYTAEAVVEGGRAGRGRTSDAEALLRGALELLIDPSNPRGCLSVQGALACGSDAEPMKQAMIEWRKHGESDIQKRLQRARTEGDLAKDVNPGDLDPIYLYRAHWPWSSGGKWIYQSGNGARRRFSSAIHALLVICQLLGFLTAGPLAGPSPRLR